ncbi:MAG: hypothetical protein ABJA64_03395 [Candidatus Saccharibacteria bacterium]
MAKKKNNYIPVKKQFMIVTGLVLLLTAFGLFVAWADAMTRQTTSGTTSFSDVTIKGESVCLPHRDTTGPQTMECAQGVKTSSGVYYAVSGVVNRNADNNIEITGTLVPATGNENYTMAGTITVK